ncbi:SCO family protein [Deinococcus sp. YIM 77859]|uniref:SCO family protein n=1 Tax=Deinococcus sp. YIM 77859 TaxID=1540221 RepID=UPI00068EF9DE|nr:SCO family protein [Deinococcus sp. YIM 77859]
MSTAQSQAGRLRWPSTPRPTARGVVLVGVVAFLLAYALLPLLTLKPAYGSDLTPPKVIADVPLRDAASGAPVSFSSARGRTLLVFFAYRRCPVVCPAILAKLARAYRQAGEPGGVRVSVVNVDPSDSPAEFARYVQRFHPAFQAWQADAPALARVASEFYLLVREGTTQPIDHTATVNVIDPQGRWRRLYSDSFLRTAEYAHDLRAFSYGRY